MDSNSLSSVKLPKFDGKEFPVWKMQMVAYFIATGLLDVVKYPFSENVNDEENKQSEEVLKKKSNRAYGVLILTLSSEQLRLVMDVEEGDAHGIWKILLERYESKTTANKNYLRTLLQQCKMSASERFDTYLSKIQQIVTNLKLAGGTVSDDEILFILTKGLPEDYNAIIDTINSTPKITFERACELLRNKQETIYLHNKQEKDQAQFVKQLYRKGNCNRCGKQGHYARECNENNETEQENENTDDSDNSQADCILTCVHCQRKNYINYNGNAQINSCVHCGEADHKSHECRFMNNNSESDRRNANQNGGRRHHSGEDQQNILRNARTNTGGRNNNQKEEKAGMVEEVEFGF